MKSSQAAFDLLVAEEVSSEAVYRRKYRRPEWPGEQSGATIGIGYDLGQTSKNTIIEDWKGRVPQTMLDAMVSACGATGSKGRAATARIKKLVDIPWETALAVHQEKVVPRWESTLQKALPNTSKLTPDCFGALLSLTFNRGPSFSKAGDRYREMRAIKSHMENEDFRSIPAELRAMKRLWPNSSGLRKRRDTEAKLFERGISAPHNQESVEIEVVQRKLNALGYHEVGQIDGKWGGRTRGAIAAFKNDRHLAEASDSITPKLLEELDKAIAEGWKRSIAPARSEATVAELEKEVPEIVPSEQTKKLSIAASAASGAALVGNAFKDSIGWLEPIKAFFADLPLSVWLGATTVVALGIAWNAWRTSHGIATAYRTGERN
jgi:hypothetical protein